MPLFIFWPVLVFWCVWCVTALVGSALLTQRLVSWARARGIVDTPNSHRSHLYQRLVIAGWSHRGVSSLYGGLAAMTAALALMPLFDPTARTTADHVVLSTIVIGMVLLIGLVLVAERSESFSDRGR